MEKDLGRKGVKTAPSGGSIHPHLLPATALSLPTLGRKTVGGRAVSLGDKEL